MRKLLVASIIVGFGWVALGGVSGTAQDKEKQATIKEVMQICMKGGLCKKVASGGASDEEKKKLAGLFAALHDNKPPKGDAADWEKRTKALVDAANDVLAGKEGGAAALQKAADCMGCHSMHKGK